MSEENVETTRRMFDAFSRNFWQEAPDFYEMLHPEVVWIPITSILEGIRFEGRDGVRKWFEEMRRTWEVYEPVPHEFRDLGDDRVLVLGTWRAQGRGSGLELDSQKAAWLMRLRDDKMIKVQGFTERDQAFEAAGLG